MSSPQPMATPNLAELLAKKPVASSPQPSTMAPVAQPATTLGPNPAPRTVDPDNGGIPPASRSNATVRGSVTPSNPAEQTSTTEAGERREYLRSLALYLPRTVHQQLGHVAAELGTTRTTLILSAVNGTHERLGAALTATTPHARSHDLFAVPQDKAGVEPSVQTTIRVTDAQYAAITALVAEHRTNRSRLITTALQLHLPESPASDQRR